MAALPPKESVAAAGLEITAKSSENQGALPEGGAESGAWSGDSAPIDPDLAAVVATWPGLPKATRQQVAATCPCEIQSLAGQESTKAAKQFANRLVRDRWCCQAKSGLTLRPMGRNPVCYNYRATLISYRSCLKPIDTFRFHLRFWWNRLIGTNPALPLSRPSVGTTAKRHQHFDGLNESGKPIALSGLGANRAFLFAEVGVTHTSSFQLSVVISPPPRPLPPPPRFHHPVPTSTSFGHRKQEALAPLAACRRVLRC